MEEAHEAYEVSKQGSKAEGVSDNPEDVQWMDKHRNSKTEALSKFGDWVREKANKEVEAAAEIEERRLARDKAEKTRELGALLEAKLANIGDPVKDVQEFLDRDVSMTGLKDLIRTDLKDRLAQIEKDKEILMAAEGTTGVGSRWERKVAHEARAKIRAAFFWRKKD